MALFICLNPVIYSTKGDGQVCYQIIVMVSTQRMLNVQSYNYHEYIYKHYCIILNILWF